MANWPAPIPLNAVGSLGRAMKQARVRCWRAHITAGNINGMSRIRWLSGNSGPGFLLRNRPSLQVPPWDTERQYHHHHHHRHRQHRHGWLGLPPRGNNRQRDLIPELHSSSHSGFELSLSLCVNEYTVLAHSLHPPFFFFSPFHLSSSVSLPFLYLYVRIFSSTLTMIL